jgi:hypothetical protein
LPTLSILEGRGRYLEVQRLRIILALGTLAVLWLGIPTMGGLVAVALSSVWQVLAVAGWLAMRHIGLLRQLLDSERLSDGTRADAAPLLHRVQARTAASWALSFVTFQCITPIAFALAGPADAGRVGFSLAVATAPLTLGLAWLQSRVPFVGRLSAEGRTAELDRAIRSAGAAALGVTLAGGATLAMAVQVLAPQIPTLLHRALPAESFVLLVIANVASVVNTAVAVRLRASRTEPLLEVIAAATALSLVSTWFGAKIAGGRGAIFGYCAATALITLPLHLSVLCRANPPRNATSVE